MNHISIERRETGPASQDRTSSAWFGEDKPVDKHLLAACDSIRKLHMDHEAFRQLVSTIGCQMKAHGFSDDDIELFEYVGDAI